MFEATVCGRSCVRTATGATAYIVDYTYFTLCIRYVSRGIYKVRNKSCLNDLYGEGIASRGGCAYITPYKDCIYWFSKMLFNDCSANLQINVNKLFQQ